MLKWRFWDLKCRIWVLNKKRNGKIVVLRCFKNLSCT